MQVRLIEDEKFPAHEGAEILAFADGILPSLVFRPAVESLSTESRRMALLAIWQQRMPALVIDFDQFAKPRLIVPIGVHGDF